MTNTSKLTISVIISFTLLGAGAAVLRRKLRPSIVERRKERQKEEQERNEQIISELATLVRDAKCDYGPGTNHMCRNRYTAIRAFFNSVYTVTDCTGTMSLLQLALYLKKLIELPEDIKNKKLTYYNLYRAQLIKGNSSVQTNYEFDNTLHTCYFEYLPFRKLNNQISCGYHCGWWFIGLGYHTPQGKLYHENNPELWYGPVLQNKVCCIAFYGNRNGKSTFIITHVKTLRNLLISESEKVWKQTPLIQKHKEELCRVNDGIEFSVYNRL